MKLTSTKDTALDGIKILVYGHAGAGKTRLIATLPRPLILSAEGGNLTLKDYDIPVYKIKSMDDLKEAYRFIVGEEGAAFQSVALDSISEIAEVVLNTAKKNAKDPRQAYGEMADQVTDLIRAFRDLPGKHVFFTAKLEKMQDETGRVLYGPGMPGNKTGQALPYFFDEVLALRVEKNTEGENVRALMCDTDGLWQAKDRSGKLGRWEEADLGKVIKKIMGVGDESLSRVAKGKKGGSEGDRETA
jgi:phage nucleotide-binding protein